MALSQKKIENLKTDKNKTTWSDGKGLLIEVTHTGVKRWYFRYMLAGHTRWMPLGYYPDMSLGEARAEAATQKVLVRNGQDPLALRHQAEAEAEAEENSRIMLKEVEHGIPTWNDLYEMWDKEHGATLDSHWRAVRRSHWRCHLSPFIGEMKLSDASKQPILAHYGEKVRQGQEATARKALALMIQLIKWSVDRQYLDETHPLTRLSMPLKKKIVREDQKPESFDIEEFIAKHGEEAIGNDLEADGAGRALRFDELVTLLHELLPASSQAETGKYIIRLMLATGIRAAEAVRLRWKWISFDRRVMIVPSGAAKRRKMHHVHLSEYAIVQLQAMLNVRTNDFVFPAPTKQNAAVLRSNVGTDINVRQFYRKDSESDEQFEARKAKRMQNRRGHTDFQLYNLPGGKWTLYDMRRTTATRLEELGFDEVMVRAVLAHSKEHATTTGRYARFSRWDNRCAALDLLGAALTECATGKIPDIIAKKKEGHFFDSKDAE